MFLRILAMLIFACGLVLLLFGTYAMETIPLLAIYSTFFASVLWGVASIFILVSKSPMDSIKIRSPKG